MSPQPSGSDEPLVPLSTVEQFYQDVLDALGEHARRRGATAQGAAAVAKRVAKQYGVPIADRLPLPRLTRAEMEDLGIGAPSIRSLGEVGGRRASAAAPATDSAVRRTTEREALGHQADAADTNDRAPGT